MAYDYFTTQQVFVNPNNNASCNTILENLDRQFGSLAFVNARFGLTGSVARIIQGEPNIPIPVIAFVTNNNDIYKYLRNNVNKFMYTGGIVELSDRFQLYMGDVNMEFWYKPSGLVLVNDGYIYSELKANIYPYIL